MVFRKDTNALDDTKKKRRTNDVEAGNTVTIFVRFQLEGVFDFVMRRDKSTHGLGFTKTSERATLGQSNFRLFGAESVDIRERKLK